MGGKRRYRPDLLAGWAANTRAAMSRHKRETTDAERQTAAADAVRRAAAQLRRAEKLLGDLSFGPAVREMAESAEHTAERLKQYGANNW